MIGDGQIEVLAGRQAQFGVARSVVIEVASRAGGTAVTEVERVIRGDENEVYRVRLADGSVVYPRIGRPGAGTSTLEVWAMERARSAGAPVPEVISLEVIDVGGGDQLVMVTAEARGRQPSSPR
ncbi:MAG TPA: hypothetical protein VIA06_22200 [Candidatus Dormibacteraeota bacterium]|nr:hypothetical protein [Candidatus Dormibacteraeota bacterium]